MFTESPSNMRFYRDNLNGFNGHMWWTYTTLSQDTCYVTWTPNLPVSGYYEVFVYVPSINANATGARYKVYYSGGTQTVVLNQSNYSDEWVSLGIFPFDIQGGYLYLGDATGTPGQKIAFDAAKGHPALLTEEKGDKKLTADIPPFMKNSIYLNFGKNDYFYYL